MPIVQLIGHDFTFPIADVLRLFYGKCEVLSNNSLVAGEDFETTIISCLDGECVSTWIDGNKEHFFFSGESICLLPKREIKRQIYLLLSQYLSRTYPWGSLTGIRPTLVAREVKSADELSNKYYVRPDKAILAMNTASFEDKILASVSPNKFCAYIGVPFCRSRCSYCSFITENAVAQIHLLPKYAQAVIKEVSGFMVRNPLEISCLYFGGGTPTVFDDQLFSEFMSSAFKHLHSENISEITVEAGRPDTITDHKLQTMKDLGVHRICINPQTLSDETLIRIGRKHTTDDFLRVFDLARRTGFKTINMDLIAGLPGETEEEFFQSIDGVLSMDPENITIHTLSKKRSSSMASSFHNEFDLLKMEAVDRMLIYANSRLNENGYVPYYLYKQKDTLGGHENTGYTKPGHECLYNVAMMSDQRSILGFGAGSISKRSRFNDRLTRCPCLRDINEYIEHAVEISMKKRTFFGV